MGTRADFYVGVDPEAMEWLGSIAFDGDEVDEVMPPEEPVTVERLSDLPAVDELRLYRSAEGWHYMRPVAFYREEDYRASVERFIYHRRDGSLSNRDGWPWPWEDSSTTDCAYTWHDGKLFAAHGSPERWLEHPVDYDDQDDPVGYADAPPARFPNMKARQAITVGPRSGLLVASLP